MGAQHQCHTMDSYLASVHSEEENNFIISHLLQRNAIGAWIGLIRTRTGNQLLIITTPCCLRNMVRLF